MSLYLGTKIKTNESLYVGTEVLFIHESYQLLPFLNP